MGSVVLQGGRFFFYVIIEGDATQVVTEINSSPPYFSHTGQIMESIIKELHGLLNIKFAHVHRELNGAVHVLAKEAADRMMDMV